MSIFIIILIKKYEEKGRAEGLVEGEAKAIEMMVMSMLHQKLSDVMIIEITHISTQNLAKCKIKFN